MTLYSVALVIPAAYAAPAPVAAIPPQAQPANIVYGDAERIELHAVETPVARLRPGEAAEITLYLSAPAKLERDYELFIQLLDESGAVLGNVTSHPGWGRNPTTLWEPGAVYPDRYLVPIIGASIEFAAAGPVYTGFINPDSPPPDHFPVGATQAAPKSRPCRRWSRLRLAAPGAQGSASRPPASFSATPSRPAPCTHPPKSAAARPSPSPSYGKRQAGPPTTPPSCICWMQQTASSPASTAPRRIASPPAAGSRATASSAALR